MTYLLVLYVLVAGNWEASIVDYDLTLEDCQTAQFMRNTEALGCEPDVMNLAVEGDEE